MGVIQTISVAVTARTANFSKGMRRVRATLRKFRKGLNKAARRIAKFGLALGAVAIGGLTLLIRNQLKAIDSTAKFAQRLGVSVESLSAFDLAAQKSGLSLQAFRVGLQRLIRRAGEAAQGMGVAVQPLKDLGIEAVKFNKLKLEDKVFALADGFETMSDAGQRVVTAFKLFDTEGVGFLQLLDDGAEGIKKMIKRAKQLGLSFNAIDAAKIEAANNALIELKAVFTGIAQTLTIELAPFITAFSNQLVDLGLSGEGMGKRVSEAFEDVLVVFAKLVNFGHLVVGTFNLIRGTILKMAGAITKIEGRIINFHERIKNAVLGIFGVDPTSLGKLTIEIGAAFSAEADAAFSAATKAILKFDAAADVDKITTFFSKVRKEAAKATTLATGGGTSLTGGARAPTRALGGFGAKAIDLERTFIGALNASQKKQQQVHDPQLETTNQILERIGRTLGTGGSVAVAG